MFNVFRNINRQYKYNKSFDAAVKLVKEGKKEQAFNQFNALLNGHSSDPFLRFQILTLGKELNIKVELPGNISNATAGEPAYKPSKPK